MRKEQFRKETIEKRKQLHPDVAQKASIDICRHILDLYPDEDTVLLAYVPIQNEVDITPLFQYYKNVYLPRTEGDTIRFYKHNGALVKGTFGVLEPEPHEPLIDKPDLILVPGVAFDKNGNRIGFGKGFYDRFLKDQTCDTVGVAYHFQVTECITDTAKHDVPVKYVITETDTYKRKNSVQKKRFNGKNIRSMLFMLFLLAIALISVEFFGTGRKSNQAIVIPQNATVRQIAAQLKDEGYIGNETLFTAYSVLTGRMYYPGPHHIDKAGYPAIAKALATPLSEQTVTVTLPEGIEVREIRDILEEKKLCSAQEFDTYAKAEHYDYDFLKDIPNREDSLEGYLFPDTYEFSYEEGAKSIINKMLANFDKKVYQPLKTDIEENNLTLDRVVIMASVIEREAANENEFNKVSGVFYNRLETAKNPGSDTEGIGGKLQSCATVQYILQERKPVLSEADTKIDSPYNTYQNAGLPIGPIASPGYKAIEAAIYPERTDYMYFVADGNGNHYFAKTFREHQQNQQKAGL